MMRFLPSFLSGISFSQMGTFFWWHNFHIIQLSVELMRHGLTPRQATRTAIERIVAKNPDFTGAVIAVNKRGRVGAAVWMNKTQETIFSIFHSPFRKAWKVFGLGSCCQSITYFSGLALSWHLAKRFVSAVARLILKFCMKSSKIPRNLLWLW